MFLKPYSGPPMSYPNTKWNYDMMTCRYEDVMPVQADPAGLTNARMALLQRSTKAVMVNNLTGEEWPLAPDSLIDKSEAVELFQRLSSFGLVPNVTLFERIYAGPYTIDWKDETRRSWVIGIMNGNHLSVSDLYKRYAQKPTVKADAETKEELSQNGLLA